MRTTFCFALLCFVVPCVYGSGWVQGANATQAGTTSVSAGFTGLTVPGNFLICGAASTSISDTFSISDSQNNIWQVGSSTYNLDTVHAVEVFYAANIVGGADTITLTGTASTTHWLGCQEWFQVGSVAQSAISNGTTANPASGSFTTATNDGIFGFVIDTATPVPGSCTSGNGWNCSTGQTQIPWNYTGNTTTNMAAVYSIADQTLSANVQLTTVAAGTWTCVGVDLADNSGFLHNPNTKYGMIAYGAKYVSPGYNSQLGSNYTAWSQKIFYWNNGPGTVTPYPYDANTATITYQDSQGMYQYQWYSVRSAGLANAGWDPERFIFHMGSDYQVSSGWTNLDQFDYFDGTTAGVNGALVYNGTAYNDVSPTLYAGTCGATCTLSNSSYYLYLGYGVPFDRMNFVFTTPMTGGTPVWQYWNGTTWNLLTLATDGTSGLTANGQIIFTPPSDWTMSVVNSGTHIKYWVRLAVGSPTIPPVLKTVKGDDWYAAAIIDYNGTTYTNCAVSRGNCGAVSNTIYFGSLSTFAGFTPTIGVANVAGAVVWQYWNGTAWTAFTPATDGTNGFTVTGSNAITLGALAGWALTTVSSESNPMYYVSATITGQTTSPTITAVNMNNNRGWCPTCAHINTGIAGVNADLEYAPNPPAGQSAHFRHQARWESLAAEYGAFNTSDQQGGVYTYPQALAGRWNTQLAANPGLFNGLFADNGGNGFQNNNTITPSGEAAQYNNVIEMPCYPTCTGTVGETQWSSGMQAAMAALTTLFHNPTSVMYGLQAGTYDSRKTLHVTFNIAGLVGFTGSGILRGVSDSALIENAATYAINNGAGFDVPTQYMDMFLTTNGAGGGTCPSIGCNTSGQLGVIEFHDDVAPIYGNFRVIRGSTTNWHTIDTSSIVPMAALAAYKIGESPNTIFYLQPGGTIYNANDDYYYWPTTTTTLTAPIVAGPSNTQTISVANAAACPAIPINTGELGGATWMQFGTTSGPGVNGTADVMSITSTGTNTFKGTSANGVVNFVNSYPTGTVVRCAIIGHLSNSAPPPAMASMFMYTSWFPAMNVDLGIPNASGWMGGNRDLGFLSGPTVSPLGTAGCGASGCPPVERRDFTKAVILFRPISGNTLDSETQTLSNNINLVSPSQMLNGPYYRLNVDGTIGPAITTVNLRAGEAAILMTQGSSMAPAISSLSPNTGPAGTVVNITGSNFGATTDTVTFGGIAATPTAWSNSSITVPVPAGATTGQVIVSVVGVQSNPMLFTVTAPVPPFPFTSFVPPIF